MSGSGSRDGSRSNEELKPSLDVLAGRPEVSPNRATENVRASLHCEVTSKPPSAEKDGNSSVVFQGSLGDTCDCVKVFPEEENRTDSKAFKTNSEASQDHCISSQHETVGFHTKNTSGSEESVAEAPLCNENQDQVGDHRYDDRDPRHKAWSLPREPFTQAFPPHQTLAAGLRSEVLSPAGLTPGRELRDRESPQSCPAGSTEVRDSLGETDQLSSYASIPDDRGLHGYGDERDGLDTTSDVACFENTRNKSVDRKPDRTLAAISSSLVRSLSLLELETVFCGVTERGSLVVDKPFSNISSCRANKATSHDRNLDGNSSCETYNKEGSLSSQRDYSNSERGLCKIKTLNTEPSSDSSSTEVQTFDANRASVKTQVCNTDTISKDYPSKCDSTAYSANVSAENNSSASQTRTRKLVVRQTKASLLRQQKPGTLNSPTKTTSGVTKTAKRNLGKKAVIKLSRDERISKKARLPKKETTFSGLSLNAKFLQKQTVVKSKMADRSHGSALVHSAASARKNPVDKSVASQRKDPSGREIDNKREGQRARPSVPTLNFMRETQCRLSRIKSPPGTNVVSNQEEVNGSRLIPGQTKQSGGTRKVSKPPERRDGFTSPTVRKTMMAVESKHADPRATKSSNLSPATRRASRKENICSELSGHAQSPKSTRRNIKVLGVTSPPEALSPITSPTDTHGPDMGDIFKDNEINQTKSAHTLIISNTNEPNSTAVDKISSSPAPSGAVDLSSSERGSNSVLSKSERTEDSPSQSAKVLTQEDKIGEVDRLGKVGARQEIATDSKTERTVARISKKSSLVSNDSKASKEKIASSTVSVSFSSLSSRSSSPVSLLSSRLPTMSNLNQTKRTSKPHKKAEDISPYLDTSESDSQSLSTTNVPDLNEVKSSRPNKDRRGGSCDKSSNIAQGRLLRKDTPSAGKGVTVSETKRGASCRKDNGRLGVHAGRTQYNTELSVLSKDQSVHESHRTDGKAQEDQRTRGAGGGTTLDIESDTNKASIDTGIADVYHALSGSHSRNLAQGSQGSSPRVSAINSNTVIACAPQLARPGISDLGTASVAHQKSGSGSVTGVVIDQSESGCVDGKVIGEMTDGSTAECPASILRLREGGKGAEGDRLKPSRVGAVQDRKKITPRTDKTPKTPPLRHRKNVKENENIRVQSELGLVTKTTGEVGKVVAASAGSTESTAEPRVAGSKPQGRSNSKAAVKDANQVSKPRDMYGNSSSTTESHAKKGQTSPEAVQPRDRKDPPKAGGLAKGVVGSGSDLTESVDEKHGARNVVTVAAAEGKKKALMNPRASQKHSTSNSQRSAISLVADSEKPKSTISTGLKKPTPSKPRAFKDGSSTENSTTGLKTNDRSKDITLRRLLPSHSSTLAAAFDTRSVTSSVSDAVSVTSSISDIRSVTSSSTRESSVDSRFGDDSSSAGVKGDSSRRPSSTRKLSLSSSSSSSVPTRRSGSSASKTITSKPSADKKKTGPTKLVKMSSLSSSSSSSASSQAAGVKKPEKQHIQAPTSFKDNTSGSVSSNHISACTINSATAATATKSTALTPASVGRAVASIQPSGKSSQNPTNSDKLLSQKKASSSATVKKTSSSLISKPMPHESKQTGKQLSATSATPKQQSKHEKTAAGYLAVGVRKGERKEEKSSTESNDAREITQENTKVFSGKGRVMYAGGDRKKSLPGLSVARIQGQSLSPVVANGESAEEQMMLAKVIAVRDLDREQELGNDNGLEERGSTLLAAGLDLADDGAELGARGARYDRHAHPIRGGEKGHIQEEVKGGEEEEGEEDWSEVSTERRLHSQDRDEDEDEGGEIERINEKLADEKEQVGLSEEAKVGKDIVEHEGSCLGRPNHDIEEVEEREEKENGHIQETLIAGCTTWPESPNSTRTNGIWHAEGPKYVIHTSESKQSGGVDTNKLFKEKGKVERCQPKSENSGNVRKGQVGMRSVFPVEDEERGRHGERNETAGSMDVESFELNGERLSAISVSDSTEGEQEREAIGTERDRGNDSENLVKSSAKKLTESLTQDGDLLSVESDCSPTVTAAAIPGAESTEMKRVEDKRDTSRVTPPASFPINVQSLSDDIPAESESSMIHRQEKRYGGDNIFRKPHLLSSLSSSSSPPPSQNLTCDDSSTACSLLTLTKTPDSLNSRVSNNISVDGVSVGLDPAAPARLDKSGVHSTPILQPSQQPPGIESTPESAPSRSVNSSTLSGVGSPATLPSSGKCKQGARRVEEEDGEGKFRFSGSDELEILNEMEKNLPKNMVSPAQQKYPREELLPMSVPLSPGLINSRSEPNFAVSAPVATAYTSPSSFTSHPDTIKTGTGAADVDGATRSSVADVEPGSHDMRCESHPQNTINQAREEGRVREGAGEQGEKEEKRSAVGVRESRDLNGTINSDALQLEHCQGVDGDRQGEGRAGPGQNLFTQRKGNENKTGNGCELSRHGEKRETEGTERKIAFEKEDAAVSRGLLLPGPGLKGRPGVGENVDSAGVEGWGQTDRDEPGREESPSCVTGAGFTVDRLDRDPVCEGEDLTKTVTEDGYHNSHDNDLGSSSRSDSDSSNSVLVTGSPPVEADSDDKREKSPETCTVDRRRSLLRQKLQKCSIDNRRAQQQRQQQRQHLDRSPSWISAADSSFVFCTQSEDEESFGIPGEVSGAVRCEDSANSSSSNASSSGRLRKSDAVDNVRENRSTPTVSDGGLNMRTTSSGEDTIHN